MWTATRRWSIRAPEADRVRLVHMLEAIEQLDTSVPKVTEV